MSLKFKPETIFKYRKIYLASLCIIFAVFAFLFSKIQYREDISEMLPDVLGREVKLFQNSPISNKLFIMIEGESPEEAQNAAETFTGILSQNTEIPLYAAKTDKDFILSYYYNTPVLWNKDFQKDIEALLTKEKIALKMEENIRNLYSPAGIFMQDIIIADPLGFIEVFGKELRSLNVSGSTLDAKNGFISSEDGKKILLIYNYPSNVLDTALSQKIDTFFGNIKSELPQNTNIFYMGAPRYTVENNNIIAQDLNRIFFVATFLMLILFFVYLREKKAIFIYLAPHISIMVAAVTAYYVFGGLSGITIGFGAVLMGLSVDYSVYMYFALKNSKEEERFQTMHLMVRPLLISAFTSIFTFAILIFSGIGVFRQVAVFCAGGLIIALFLALFVAPFVFSCQNEKPDIKEFDIKTNKYFAIIFLILIFAGAIISFGKLNFNASLNALNTVSEKFTKDYKVFSDFTGDAYSKNEFLFIFGDTKEEALRNNEIVSAKNKNNMKLAKLFPSDMQKEMNLKNWKEFWNEERIEFIKTEIEINAKKYGIKSDIFNDFYEFLQTGKISSKGSEMQDFDLAGMYDPIMSLEDKFAFVNILKKGTVINDTEEVETLFISSESLDEKIVHTMSLTFTKIMIALFFIAFFVLVLFWKNLYYAALSILPPLCGICIFLIMSALLQIELNLFALFAMPLLIGLGIDYGVFMIFKFKGQKSELHPTRAVIVAALSTLIGFGSLMAGQHKVLFGIGFMVFIGISASIFAAIFIVPAFLKKQTKILKAALLLLIFLIPISGCYSGAKINYNVSAPQRKQGPAGKEQTMMFFGSYKEDNLQFRVISVAEDDGHRVVIMSDLGVKLQDMKLKSDGETDIYFSIEFMPKNTVESFAEFFSEYFSKDQTDNDKIRDIGGRTYYYKGGTPVLWVKEI